MITSFSTDRRLLLDGVSALLLIAPHKPQRDILKCIKIKAEIGINGVNDQIRLFATDLESYITYTIKDNIIVQNEGEFVVSGQVFSDYLKNLEEDTISIHLSTEETLQINESGVELEVGLQDLQEFPEFPEIPSGQLSWIDMDYDALKSAIARVIFAVAEKNNPKWALNSVLISLKNEIVSLVGTDTHRISIVEFSLPNQKTEGQYLISASILEILPKILTENFQIISNSNNIIIKSSNIIWFLRLTGGSFPEKINIPKHPQHIILAVQDFEKQVKKAALAVDQHSTIRIEIKDGKICLSAKTRQERKGVKIERAIDYKGNGIQFLINSKYLLELLKASHNDEALVLHFNQNNQPLLFTQLNFQHIVVPQEIR